MLSNLTGLLLGVKQLSEGPLGDPTRAEAK